METVRVASKCHSHRLIPLSLILIASSLGAIAQAQTPYVFSVLNSASYDATAVAQGSLVVIFGVGLGPSALTQAPTLPLPNVLAGTTVTVTSGATLNCPLLYTSYGQLAAVLPSGTPVGPALLTVAYNGATGSGSSIQIEVAASSVGIFSLNGSGSGGGIFTALDGALRTSDHSAKPGDVVTIWATGVGPVNGPDNAVPATFPNYPGIEVLVGSQSAKVIYAGRSGCCAAVDQISFEMPQNAAGCYLPVAVRSGGGVSNGGRVSNFVSIPAGSASEACSDTTPVLPPALVNRAAAQQPVKIGILGVGPTGVLAGLGFHSSAAVARALTAVLGVRVSEEDADRAMRAARSGNNRKLSRALFPYRATLKKLDPKTRARLEALVHFNQTGAYAAFVRYDNATILGPLVAALFTPPGTCSVLPAGDPPLSSASTTPLDAGSSLGLLGPGGPWTLKAARPGQYQTTLGAETIAGIAAPGIYTMSGAGGRDVGAFSATRTVSAPAIFSNKATLSDLDPAQALNLRWTGGPQSATGPAYVVIGGYTSNLNEAFVCTEVASNGNFTVPAHVLSGLRRRNERNATIFIGVHPLSNSVTIPGLDAAYFFDGSFDSSDVTFRVASAPVLKILKSHSGNFAPGSFGTWAINVSNSPSAGPTTQAVTVSDTLPAGLTLSSMGGAGWNCSGATCSRADVLAPGSAFPPIIVTANISATAPSQITNQATVSGGGSAGATATDVSNIVGPPSLKVSKSHSGNFSAGQVGAVYSIVVSNASAAGPTAGTVTVTETLPTGLTLTSMAGTGWICSGTACSRSDLLAPGSSYPAIAATVNVAADAASQITNRATVSGGGSAIQAADDITNVTSLPTTAALHISSSHNGNFTQGQSGATYAVTVSNASTTAFTNGIVTVTETLPAALILPSIAGNGWSCLAAACTRSDSLAPGSSYPTIVVTAEIAANAPAQITNVAKVTGGGFVEAAASDLTIVAPSAVRMTLFTERTAFIAQTGVNSIAGLEDVPDGPTPFTSGGVTFTELGTGAPFFSSTPQVASTIAGFAASAWFPNNDSGTRFMIMDGGFRAALPADAKSIGLDYSCSLGCAFPATQIFQWQLLSASGAIVASGTSVADFTNRSLFFGLTSAAPFRSIVFQGGIISVPGSNGRVGWLADNLRYAP